MRRGRDCGILFDANKGVMGINLGSDFTSEHEWGIKGIRSLFGMNDAGLGLGKRTITQMPVFKSFMDKKAKPCAHLIETKDETVLIVAQYFEPDAKFEPQRWELSGYGDAKLFTAWDEKSLGVRALGPLEREAVRAVYAAMQKLDLAIWLGGGGVFQNAGLVLCIASRIPQDKAQALHDADVDYIKLQDAGKATGIAERLEKAGKRYYALSPKWANNSSSKTKHPVIYWLNPCDQQDNNFGWFTVEQLDEWAQNKGPIPMSQEQKRKARA